MSGDDELRKVRADAINAVADKWQWGEWANHLDPNPIARAQSVTDWLRAQARYAATEGRAVPATDAVGGSDEGADPEALR